MGITSDREKLTQFIVECFRENKWAEVTLFGRKYFSFQKKYKTFRGNQTAYLNVNFWKNNEFILAGFSGEFTSAGENALCVLSTYLKHGMNKEEISASIKQLVRETDAKISKSFCVKILRFKFKKSGTFLKIPYKKFIFDRTLMGNSYNKVEFCSCCGVEHSKVF